MPRAGWAAAGAVSAALLSEFLLVPAVAALVGAAVVTAVVTARARQVRFALAAVGAATVLIRALIGGVTVTPQPDPSHLAQSEEWRGEVVSLGSARDGKQPVILSVAPAGANEDVERGVGGEVAPGEERVRAYVELPRYPIVIPGDRIRFRAELRPAPVGDGFAEYLARNRVVLTGSVREFETGGGVPGGAMERMRRGAAGLLAATIPEPQAGLATGILVGIRDRLHRDVADAFTTSGLSHIVAISGWNIALVGAVMASLLRHLGRRRRSVVIVAAIASYALLTGASPSVVRAALMGGIVLVARECGRPGAAATALGLAAWLMLLVEPTTVNDAGYRLSVAATAGLLAWATPLTALVGTFLPGRTPHWLTDSLGVSLAAQAATLPLVLADFGRLSLVAPLANLLVAPLVAPAMFVAAAGLAAGSLVSLGVPVGLGVIVGTAGWAVLGSIIAVARLTAAVPFASVDVPPPSNLLGGALAALFLFVLGTPTGRHLTGVLRSGAVAARRPGPPPAGMVSRRPLRTERAGSGDARRRSPSFAALPLTPVVRVSVLGLAGMVALLVLVFVARPDGRLRMTVLDVGQGDAILLEGSRGGRILVDAGPDPDRVLALLDERVPPWDRRIDLVILSHPHEDHAAGLALLLARYQVAVVAETGVLGPGPGYEAYREELARTGRTAQSLGAGDQLELDDARIKVLWPPRDIVPERADDDGKGLNNLSIVLDVHFGQRRMLLGGDMEQEIDPQLLRGGLDARHRPLDVLKVAHHGSATATTPELLAALRPKVAIISAGTENRYGHPASKTLAALAAAGARTLRTDRDGSVTVTSDGRDLEVQSTGRRPDGRRSRSTRPASSFLQPLPDPMPRIAGWSPPVVTRFSCSFPSARPIGSWPTSPRSRRSRPSWARASPPGGRRSTAAWSRPPHSFTTSTSCSRRGTRCVRSVTGTRGHTGWPSRDTRSSLVQSPLTPSRA